MARPAKEVVVYVCMYVHVYMWTQCSCVYVNMYIRSQAHIFSAQDTITVVYTHGLHMAQHFGAVQNIQSAHTHLRTLLAVSRC